MNDWPFRFSYVSLFYTNLVLAVQTHKKIIHFGAGDQKLCGVIINNFGFDENDYNSVLCTYNPWNQSSNYLLYKLLFLIILWLFVNKFCKSFLIRHSYPQLYCYILLALIISKKNWCWVLVQPVLREYQHLYNQMRMVMISTTYNCEALCRCEKVEWNI